MRLNSNQVEVHVIEKEVVVQDGDRHSRAGARTVGIVVERVVCRFVPKYLCHGCRSGRICDEMRGVERARVSAPHSQTIAECPVIESEQIALAVMTAEVDDVIGAIGGGGVDETVGSGTAGQVIGTTLAFEKVVAAIA